MQCKYLLILSIYLLPSKTSTGQEINWKNSKNWKLYNIHNKAGFRYSLDTLQYFKNIDLNMDTLQTFIEDVTVWPKEKYSMWMGLYVATCETEDKKIKKIIISTYGGFFYDQTTKRYYQIPSELTDQWLAFLNDCSKRMRHD